MTEKRAVREVDKPLEHNWTTYGHRTLLCVNCGLRAFTSVDERDPVFDEPCNPMRDRR